MQRKKPNAMNKSIGLFESQLLPKNINIFFTVFTIYQATKLRREIDEKHYAAEKKGRDEFYPERGRWKKRSFFIVAKC